VPLAPAFDQFVTFLYTRDLERSAAFYGELLGLPLVLDQGGCRIFRVARDGFLGVYCWLILALYGLFVVFRVFWYLLLKLISCWEIAKLVEKGRIAFSIPTLTWILRSLTELGIYIVELSPEIAVESTQLPDFHQDPADQIIVATSRVLGMPLVRVMVCRSVLA